MQGSDKQIKIPNFIEIEHKKKEPKPQKVLSSVFFLLYRRKSKMWVFEENRQMGT